MASRGEELLISADSHVIEDPHFWENRLPAAFKDQVPAFPEREVGGLFQAHAGGWDPHERVKEIAVDGVSGEVLYPSFAMNLFGLQDAALQEACFRVYNDWILEYCSVAPDRLYGIPTYDIDHGVAELERCRKSGLLGAPGVAGTAAGAFPFGEHRRPGYSVGLTCGGARRAARSSAMICCRHSMPSLVKAVTPSSPTP
jgi:predicted TIM-barrel fold metal-dependent hydrolase